MPKIKELAVRLLEEGKAARILGWRRGLFEHDLTPGIFSDKADIEKNFVYNEYSTANLSKYLIKEAQKEGAVAVFLKPCDTYSLNQLIAEHKVKRENVFAVAVHCPDGGMLGEDGEVSVKCKFCKSRRHVVFDLMTDGGAEAERDGNERFREVERIECMTPEERFEFFRGELSRCIRCNACRNVCPACTCEKCIFDDPASGMAQKAASDPFEENLFHMIRAFHVAGRCTDCGECSRVCPEHIPLHLLNRKLIKDQNELWGEYQAGADPEARGPLVSYRENDADPSSVTKKAACNISNSVRKAR